MNIELQESQRTTRHKVANNFRGEIRYTALLYSNKAIFYFRNNYFVFAN